MSASPKGAFQTTSSLAQTIIILFSVLLVFVIGIGVYTVVSAWGAYRQAAEENVLFEFTKLVHQSRAATDRARIELQRQRPQTDMRPDALTSALADVEAEHRKARSFFRENIAPNARAYGERLIAAFTSLSDDRIPGVDFESTDQGSPPRSDPDAIERRLNDLEALDRVALRALYQDPHIVDEHLAGLLDIAIASDDTLETLNAVCGVAGKPPAGFGGDDTLADAWRHEQVGENRAQWDALARRMGRVRASPGLSAAFSAADARLAAVHRSAERAIGAAAEAPDPDVDGQCAEARASVVKLGVSAIETGVRLSQIDKSNALLFFCGALALFDIAGLSAAFSFHVVRNRLTRRLARLVATTNRLTRRDYADPVEPPRIDDELGVMFRALEDFRTGAIEAEKLQHDLDRTRRAQLEELSEASRAKSEFLATMSHEVRTPLNGILGMAELLASSRLDPQQKQWLRGVSASGAILLSILNDILDFSKIESGRLEIENIPFSLRQTIDNVRFFAEPQASSQGTAFQVTCEDAVPDLLKGDPAKLGQVLFNLVGNAIKFTSEGAVDLVVSCVGADQGLVRLRFDVADTGIGIPKDAIARLFEPFTQSDSSITRRFGGTGLGLAICRRIVEAMNGSISVVSQPGEGSTFSVELSFDRAKTSLPHQEPGREAAARSGLRILVADDNEVNALVAKAMLEQLGHTVSIAIDGDAAVDAVVGGDFDLVFMDLAMPGCDGLTAIRRIRALADPERARVLVVALTANVSHAAVDDCLAAGMNGFLSKPFRIGQLAVAIERVFDEAATAGAATADPGGAMIEELLRCGSEIGPERLGTVVDTFLATLPTMLAELRAYATDGNFAATRRIARSLSSAAMTLGLRETAMLCRKFERLEAAEVEEMAETAAMAAGAADREIVLLAAAWSEVSARMRERPRSRRDPS